MPEEFKQIIVTILTSGAFFSFAQFIISRWDNKKGMKKQIDRIDERLDTMEKGFDEKLQRVEDNQERHIATLARTHILRFADEQRQLVKSGATHSEEYFKQQLQDIDTYNAYCDAHKDFANGLTIMASECIKEEYKRVYLDNDH